MKNKLSPLIPLLILSASFRLFRLKELFFFSLDEEVIALHIRRIISFTHFPAIGVNAADTGLYLGPFYLYLPAPLFWLLHGNPLAGAIFSAIIGITATAAVYWAVNQFAGKKPAVYASLIHATALPVVLFERKFFNPQPAILVSALILGLLANIRVNPKITLPLLALLLGLIFHLNLMLCIYIVIALVWIYLNKPKANTKTWIISIAIGLSMIGPLAFFDIRHDHQLTRAAISLITGQKQVVNQNPGIINRVLFPGIFLAKLPLMNLSTKNIVNEFNTCPQATKNLPSLIGIILFIITIATHIVRPQRRLLLTYIALALGVSVLWLYPGRVQEYYAMILVVPYLILVGTALDSIRFPTKNIAALLAVTMLTLSNLTQLFLIANPHGLTTMEQLTKKIVENTKPQAFSLTKEGEACGGYGFEYLLFQQQHPPSQSFADPIIAWLYSPSERPEPSQSITTATIMVNTNNISVTFTPTPAMVR